MIQMNADAARKKTLEHRTQAINIIKNNIMDYISRAAGRGYSKISYEIPDEDMINIIADWLKKLGYEVEVEFQFWNIKW